LIRSIQPIFQAIIFDEYSQDYTLEEINININDPLEVEGNATLTGNININTALKAFEDVTLNGRGKKHKQFCHLFKSMEIL